MADQPVLLEKESATEKPDVSVLMPTYNDSKYIFDAINSVLSQGYRNWELVIIDDGSTDNTPDIIKKFNDQRIVCMRKENSGQLNASARAVARQLGEMMAESMRWAHERRM